jgi:hypothetical protein
VAFFGLFVGLVLPTDDPVLRSCVRLEWFSLSTCVSVSWKKTFAVFYFQAKRSKKSQKYDYAASATKILVVYSKIKYDSVAF